MSAVLVGFLDACWSPPTPAVFDPRECMQTVPAHVDGLQILAGPRGAPNILRDMVPAICNGQVLFRKMQDENPDLNHGTVHFKVVVEYTGEVTAVVIEETTIASPAFLRKARDFIMDSDFTPWARSDEDSVFIYPVHFGS
jgi:hypothetical protein